VLYNRVDNVNDSAAENERSVGNVKEFNIPKKSGTIDKKILLHPHGKQANIENKDKRYSQVKQDEVVYGILQKDGGFFVDIGAHDGQFLSNTLWLERQHSWTGLLIEANPELCAQIDKLKRNAWRLCACLSSTQKSVSFIKGGNVGGMEETIDEHHMKMLDKKNKVTVPCYSLEKVLDDIGVHHIDFYSLDVEGAEMVILDSMKSGLKSGTFTVDVWSIEYRVWDGEKIIVEKSKENLKALRDYFKAIGGYFEHSQLSNDANNNDGYALDVVFVRTAIWCKMRNRFPDGTACPGKDSIYDIKDYLLAPHPERQVDNVDKMYSQAQQDQVVYNITKKDGGFFVDIGAHDGQFLSNSLWLERKHKWTGLLIEANPELCSKIDTLKRRAWRMCACLSSTMKSVSFIKGDTVGGIEQNIDEHHIKMLNKQNKITVPCFSLEAALVEVKNTHIDFFSLDVEGAEMAILDSLQSGLKSKQFIVDVWSIEYRVWDGKQIVVEKSLENLNALRKYFQTLGGYSEHSQLSHDGNFKDGYALDVVFVRNEMWCKSRDRLPNGTACSS
jgi:FkbM family methyltransferase